MAYTDFSLLKLNEQFGLTDKVRPLFDIVPTIEPSDILLTQLKRGFRLPLRNEKAKSEFIVSQLLLEIIEQNEGFFTLYSGENLSADEEKGLNGECDFYISRNTGSFAMNMPILAIIEAKRDNIEAGVDQCAAQLYGASIVNQRLGHPIQVHYGCVTNARKWLFLKLEHSQFTIDARRY